MFAVKHPRWEPYAGKPLVRICAGGAQQWASLPRSGDRHLGSSSDTDDVLLVSLRELVFLSPLPHAARNTTPAGTSPVVTRRHKAISNLRARATIIVLRFLPPSVRVRYHWANALSF